MSQNRTTRRKLLQSAMASVAGLALNSTGAAFLSQPLGLAVSEAAGSQIQAKPFRVELPRRILPFPQGVDRRQHSPGFRMRGIKGLTWTVPQYLAEIPVMAKYKMNFLMNCYTSLWNLEAHDGWGSIASWKHANHWYAPLPEVKRRGYERVVQECRRHGMEFCFSMNPILASDRPFEFDKPEDLEALWRHYAWMQGLGAKWFNVSLDDIQQGITGAGQARVTNEILRRLRKQDAGAQVIFTPSWYAGTGDSVDESAVRLGSGDTPGHRYVREVAQVLDPEIYIYWTGPEVCSMTIRRADAEKYRRLVNHRLFIWDNYPCNDQHPNLQLGPLMGRGPDLASAAEGYISNPLSPQDEANRIPMLTIADYLWNPGAYNPDRSIGQAIAHLCQTPRQRHVLKGLVELYPGRLVGNSQSTGWNSLRKHFSRVLGQGLQRGARGLVSRAEGVSRGLEEEFPGCFLLARKTLDTDIKEMQKEYSAKFS